MYQRHKVTSCDVRSSELILFQEQINNSTDAEFVLQSKRTGRFFSKQQFQVLDALSRRALHSSVSSARLINCQRHFKTLQS